jgi:hypothetical protein
MLVEPQFGVPTNMLARRGKREISKMSSPEISMVH